MSTSVVFRLEYIPRLEEYIPRLDEENYFVFQLESSNYKNLRNSDIDSILANFLP